ncbi:MAG: Filamentation induced by cAMP protein Fic [candidate division WWE3 bacterium GW2011_GWC2_44_9]|uniref:Filamentation induced by cAMP protein Fic n=1 Tax=candidate division WWE3 bacterium GW2011_GWC2_44_9 TaxID=1619125 RepID=A0A0G1MVR3_UNCKA|nr:MAG: Filamentation induced by cAMP protein Fic [candidate division WWE3 bacterium GW2011_GWC2_44_9]
MFIPKYKITNKIVSQLTEIAEIRALVSKSTLLPEREMFLRRAAVVKMVHSSTSIEGNTLKEHQVAQVAEGKEVPAEKNQVLEIRNYLAALRDVDLLAGRGEVITTQAILRLHKVIINGLVEKEKAGMFRPGQVYVVNVLPNKEEEVAYTPPKSTEVPEKVAELVGWLKGNGEIHPVLKTGLFHYQFETIHPFTDGNGRTGRLLTLLQLYLSGWDFKKILVLEDYYNRNRKAYYEALQTGATYKTRQDADLTNWLEYFVAGFLDEAKRVKDQVLNLSVVGDVGSTRNVLDKDEIQIVDFVITMGQITSEDVADILGVPKRTAQDKLKRLEDAKVLKKKGSGPNTVYIVRK